MVVRFHLHQDVAQLPCFLIAVVWLCTEANAHFWPEHLHLAPGHHGGVVAVRHHGVLRVGAVRGRNHGEQACLLRLPVDDELGVEYLVAAVLTVGLREHHQLHIRGVAPHAREGAGQVINLLGAHRQPPFGVCLLQRLPAACQHIHMRHTPRGQRCKQRLRRLQTIQHALCHAVVQQRGKLRPLLLGQWPGAGNAPRHQALDAPHRQAAAARNVGGFARPR